MISRLHFLSTSAGVARASLMAAAVLGTGLAGCTEQEGIAHYAVPKETPPTSPSRDPEEFASNPTAWFFKLQGPADSVGTVAEQFTALAKSVRFESGKPTWTLPEGWSEQPGTQMRFATLKVDSADPPLEVSVIPLPVFGSDPDEYLRQNIDRWRGQIGLNPMEGSNWLANAQAAGEVQTTSITGVQLTLVDLTGKSDDGSPVRLLGAVLLPDEPRRAD